MHRLLLTAAALLVAAALLGLAQASSEAVAAAAAPPSNTAKPKITGTAEQGRVLTASTGTWSGTTPIKFDFQWQRCDSAGSGCSLIPGATSQTYTLVSADVGRRIRVVVTATNTDGSRSASSDPTAVVKAAPRDAPKNTSTPNVSGNAQEGSALTVSNGSWSGTQPITYTYQWLRCNTGGGACLTIAGATGKTYALVTDDVGKRMRANVTATNAIGAASVTSSASGTVSAAPASAPKNTALPAVSGTAREGSPLTASPGTWSGTLPITYEFRWQRCSSAGASCANVSGATGQSYTPTSADAGDTLRVVVTATNSAGSSSASSAVTAAVGAGTPTGTIVLPSGRKSVPASSVALPARLVIDGVKFTPNPLRSRGALVVGRIHVSDNKGNVVRDARVLLIGIPFGQITNPPEVVTGVDGWATVQFRSTARLSGTSLVMFLRARKLGDSVLAGVSTRRLVQLRLALG